MTSKIKFLSILTLAIYILSCECPVNVDPEDKIVKPTEYGNMLFINAMPETYLDSLYVTSNSSEPTLERVDTIYYNPPKIQINRYKNYRPIGLKYGNRKNVLRIIVPKDSTLLFNNVLDIKKDSNYTFIAFGKDNSLQSVLMKDYIKNPLKDNIYIRCVNVSPDAPKIHFNVNTEKYSQHFSLNSGEFSDIAAAPSGDFYIELTSADSVLVNTRISGFTLSKGKVNNIIFRGYYKKEHINSREIIIVTGDYPFK
jgi:hypothetical protein